MNCKTITCLLSSAIFLMLWMGCEYKTDEVFFTDVKKEVEPPDLEMTVNLDADTVYVYGSAHVKLKVKLSNKTLYSVKFIVDDQVYNQVHQDDNGYYNVDLYSGDKQSAVLRAEIYTSTGTGSIADKLSSESFQFKPKEWIVVFCKDKPRVTTEIVDGRLKVSWTPAKSKTRLKYYIQYGDHKDSTYQPWYIDSSFIGGGRYYSISTENDEIRGYYASSEIRYPTPTFTIQNRDSFVVVWDKCKFYNNIKGYRLTDGYSIDLHLGASDTSYTFKKGTFGASYWFELEMIRKHRDNSESSLLTCGSASAYYQLFVFPKGTSYSESYFPLKGNICYYYSSDYYNRNLSSFDLAKRSSLTSIRFSGSYLAISPNNSYLLSYDGLNVQVFEASSLNLIRKQASYDILGGAHFDHLSISDLGVGLFFENYSDSLYVYDLLNQKKRCRIPCRWIRGLAKISADSKYVFEPNGLYQIGEDSYTPIWVDADKKSRYVFFEFDPDRPDHICVYDGSNFLIKSCSDFSTLQTFSFNNEKMQGIDFNKQKILTSDGGKYKIYSLADGAFLGSVPAFFSSDKDAFLYDDYIFKGNCQFNINTIKE